jgi:hypothetical protein
MLVLVARILLASSTVLMDPLSFRLVPLIRWIPTLSIPLGTDGAFQIMRLQHLGDLLLCRLSPRLKEACQCELGLWEWRMRVHS